MDYKSLAKTQITELDNFDSENLTDDQILELVKRYYANTAAQFQEDQWRRTLSTLDGSEPIIAILTATEWLVKGPDALKVLAGGESDFISTEANIISIFSPETPKSTIDVAMEVGSRFTFWVRGGMLLTSMRRATQHKLWVQTTPDAVRIHFLLMQFITTLLGNAAGNITDQGSFDQLQSQIGVLAQFSNNADLINTLIGMAESNASDSDIIAVINQSLTNAQAA